MIGGISFEIKKREILCSLDYRGELWVWERRKRKIHKGAKALKIPGVIDGIKQNLSEEEFLEFQQRMFEEL